MNDELFSRIERLYQTRDSLELDDESARLLEKTYRDFLRAGAALNREKQEKLKENNAELAILETRVSQNILNEANDLSIIVDSRIELDGLSENRINSAAEEAMRLSLIHI